MDQYQFPPDLAMSHPVSPFRSELSHHLHTLVQLLQRVPGARGERAHAAFFDTVRATLIDVCAASPEPWPGADALAMLAITQLECQSLKNDPLVFDLLQLLRVHGFLEGKRRTRLTATLRRVVGRHLRLFWQETDAPALAVAVTRSQRANTVELNPLNRPWSLLPGLRGAEHRVAANEPDAQPDAHRASGRPVGAEPALLPAA